MYDPGHACHLYINIYIYIYVYIYMIYLLYMYTSGTSAQDHTQCIKNIYIPLYIRICIDILPIAYCLLPIAYCSGGCVAAGHGCSHAP